MALAARVVTAGFSPGQAKGLAGGVAPAVSAAGTTQGTATALSASINYVSTVAASAGVIIPLAEVADSIEIYNAGANALKIYPPVGAAINQIATNGGMTLATNTAAYLRCVSSTQWIAFLSA